MKSMERVLKFLYYSSYFFLKFFKFFNPHPKMFIDFRERGRGERERERNNNVREKH